MSAILFPNLQHVDTTLGTFEDIGELDELQQTLVMKFMKTE